MPHYSPTRAPSNFQRKQQSRGRKSAVNPIKHLDQASRSSISIKHLDQASRSSISIKHLDQASRSSISIKRAVLQ